MRGSWLSGFPGVTADVGSWKALEPQLDPQESLTCPKSAGDLILNLKVLVLVSH